MIRRFVVGVTFFIAGSNQSIASAKWSVPPSSSFVPNPIISPPRSIGGAVRRQQLAFVDNNKGKGRDNKQGVDSEMEASSKEDAEAYHAMASAAVDLTDIYARNGVVSATRSVRDIDANSRRKFLYTIPVRSDDGSPPIIAPPVELPSKIKARIPSPSGSKLAILVEESIPSTGGGKPSESKRHVFEIWTDQGHRLAGRLVLPAEKHGAVCTDFAWFGGISWSPDESALVYTAEVTKPKAASFFSKPPSKDDGDGPPTKLGGQYTLGVGKSEDWGEKYGTTALLALFCLDVVTGKVGMVENVPGSSMKDATTTEGGYVLGQPIFSPCGQAVVYTGWDAGGGGEMPKRLGAIYCFQRPCKLYSSPVTELLGRLSKKGDDERTPTTSDAPFDCITPGDRLARSPRFSKPDGETARLAYLCNSQGFDTHGGCMGLVCSQWDMSRGSVTDGSTRTIVDVVQLPGERGDETEVAGIKFPGLFMNHLPEDCFSRDGRFIVATTQWGSLEKIVKISLGGGNVSPVNFDLSSSDGMNEKASQQFKCFLEDGGAIVTQSESNRPTILGCLPPSFLDEEYSAPSRVLADLPSISSTSFSSLNLDTCSQPSDGYSYELNTILPSHGDVKVPVGTVLLLPANAEKRKLPLIVVPHGGPHSCMSTGFVPSYGYLCKHGGYAVLHVNFRGSTGFGQAALESLAGQVGTLDVLDVVAATRSVIDEGIADPDRVGICGGSHGGFLASHLIGQHPDLFKVAAMRNPVTNIASMTTATDIPDWCYIETLGTGNYNFADFRAPTKEQLGIMWGKSPIAHLDNVKAPTLMGIGMKDRRVPPSQGIEYYHALRAGGVPAKMLVYEDCDHAIDLVASEADFWINAKQWFDEHL